MGLIGRMQMPYQVEGASVLLSVQLSSLKRTQKIDLVTLVPNNLTTHSSSR